MRSLFRVFLSISLFGQLAFAAPKLELGKEYPPDGEDLLIKGMVDGTLKKFEKELEDKKPKTAIRDAHPVHHGCARATFLVLDNIPENLRKGVFEYDANGKPREYKAWIRFSNGSGTPQADYMPDGRGMAIKLSGVTGERVKLDKKDEKATQDFTMINFPQFFVKDVADYIEFFKDKGKFLATHEMERNITIGIASQFTTTPLEARYFSMVPVGLGSGAMKYSAEPCTPKKTFKVGELDLAKLAKRLAELKTPEEITKHAAELKAYDRYLKLGLETQLAANEACFEFALQPQVDADKQPIEDPRVKWESPFYKVARIIIPAQTISSKAQNEFCENLALTPWHTLVATTPKGGIQRARRGIYEVISDSRHKYNNVKYTEPTGDEVFAD